MSNLVFPAKVRGLTWTILKNLSNSNIQQKSASGFRTSIAQMMNPFWKWQLIYDYIWDDPTNIASGLIYTDLKTLMGFVMARQNDYDDFLFDDITDDAVTDQQLQVVNDGAGSPTYYSPVQRNMAGQFFEDITDLNGTIAVKANGVPQTLGTDYSILGPGLAIPGYSFGGLVLKWLAGAPALPVTATFQFYFRVHFTNPGQDFEKFDALRWTIGGSENKNGQATLDMETSRIGTV